MSKMAEHMDWESEAPNLARLQKTNAFGVPPTYFDDLENRIKQSVFLSELSKEENGAFSTPDNYFADLASQISTKIALETNRNGNGFSVPENYFNNLQQAIVDKAVPAKKTIKIWHQPLFKYAVAASLVIVSTTGWFANKTYQQNQTQKLELAKEQILFDIDENTILEYLHEDQNAKSKINSQEMESYILDNFSSNDLSNNF